MTHYLIAQLHDGSYDGTAVLSPAGTAEMHRAAVPTPAADTSYGMGWFVGPVNDLPAIFVELMGITAVVVDLTCGPANLSGHSRCLVADYGRSPSCHIRP